MDHKELASHLDLANHRANATADDIKSLCADVVKYGFNGAFVNPCYVALAKQLVDGRAKVGTVVSFPLGQDILAVKISGAVTAIQEGADELDCVPNLGDYLSGNEEKFLSDMKEIVAAARGARRDIIVKFILETGYFDALPDGPEKIKKAAILIRDAGADFVKICSGMGPRGASANDVKLVREAVGNTVKVKAAGGIDTLAEANELIAAGADRLGTSRAVKIIEEAAQ